MFTHLIIIFQSIRDIINHFYLLLCGHTEKQKVNLIFIYKIIIRELRYYVQNVAFLS